MWQIESYNKLLRIKLNNEKYKSSIPKFKCLNFCFLVFIPYSRKRIYVSTYPKRDLPQIQFKTFQNKWYCMSLRNFIRQNEYSIIFPIGQFNCHYIISLEKYVGKPTQTVGSGPIISLFNCENAYFTQTHRFVRAHFVYNT